MLLSLSQESGAWDMIPSSPFFAFAGLDDVPVSLGDCPHSPNLCCIWVAEICVIAPLSMKVVQA